MFGYVRPLKGELKLREYEQFKSLYCGLCRKLKYDYGWISSFMLSYDLTFLAMLICDETPQYTNCRCIANPFRKRCVCSSFCGLERAAAITVILAWHKLRDSLNDEGLSGRLKARLGMLVSRRAYKKARKAEPRFDEEAGKLLAGLAEIEAAEPDSVDIPADYFGKLLESITVGTTLHRITGNLLYNLGRWIYIVDAWDDFEQDVKDNKYNPLRCRFGCDELGETEKETVRITLSHSENLMRSAFQLLPENAYTSVIENVLYLGLPAVVCQVACGTWRKNNNKSRHPIT